MTANIIAYDYHRNGVGGEGFYSVTFTTKGDRDSTGKTFTAVVTEKHAYVMRQLPNCIDHGDHYRGTDYFHSALMSALSKKIGYKPFS